VRQIRPNGDSGGPGGLRIGIVGAGVAGITTATLLDRRHRVCLLEKNARLGGHTNTVVVEDGPDAGTAVDTGFIVLNDKTYPGLHYMLRRWGVRVRDSDMSFSFFSEENGSQYAGPHTGGLFARRRNLFHPGFWRFLAEIPRFRLKARRDLESGYASGLTLEEYFRRRGYSTRLREEYVVPMGAAIWSTPPVQMLDYPAEVFLRFFKNHGLLNVGRELQWQTVVGGSHSYIRVFERTFNGEIISAAPVTTVRRSNDRVLVHTSDGNAREFDHVVLATHADEALGLLADPTPEESRLLGAWRYQLNRTVLHTDTSLLPPNRRAWASWNYRRESGPGDEKSVSITYHMNRLQGLKTEAQYCVTLNTSRTIDPASVIARFDYTHPLYDFESIATQSPLEALNGNNRTWYCGSYMGYGFHEDAVQSAMAVVDRLDTGPGREVA
jgi:predicted NAD/FAD-binding protein